MLQHQRLFLFRRSYVRVFSSGDGSSDANGDLDVDKLVDFFKKAEDHIVRPQDKVALDAAKQIAEAPVPPTPPTVQATISSSRKRNDDKQIRHSAAPRLVPWTSNRLQKEYRVTKITSKGQTPSFAKMFRESNFTQLGNFKHREIIGVVIENANDSDLYVDYGGKLLAVVPQPEGSFYPRGSLVRVRLHEPEMANRFMINTRAISLLEADATLIGPYRGQVVHQSQESVDQGYMPLPTVTNHTDSSHVKMNKDFVSIDNWKLD